MTSDQLTAHIRSRAGAREAVAFDRFATGVIYIITLGLGAVSTAQTDLWWLLRAGKEFWHTGHVTLVERYSHTASGRSWPNHEWLWEAIAYALHHVAGMPMLSMWTGGTVAATAWVCRRSSRATGYVVPLVLGAALPLTSITWATRPQVTSLLLFAVTMLLLVRERYGWIPPLFLVWANLHAQVVMGGALLGTALLAAAVDAVQTRSECSRRRLARLSATTAAAAFATMLTPLGPGLWTYVTSANGRPGQGQIEEWATAFSSPLGALIIWPLLVAALLLGFQRRQLLTGWEMRVPALAAVAMAPLGVLAVRNVPFFVVAAIPLFMNLLEFQPRQPIGRVGRWREGLAAFALATALAVAAVWFAAPPRLAWHPVPAGLAAALRQCPGPLYNDYDEGAALVWFVPDVKVFVDNRQDPYPASVIDASMGLTPRAYPRTFARFGIGCALLPRDSALVGAIRRDGWTPTYEDNKSVVLVPPPRISG